MIRPLTAICMVLAGASGLYLYQTKHRAQVLDREIARTVHQTETTRERIGMLRAEWALLNEPDRLTELAKAHTNLRTLAPTQFVSLADLAAKLPAPVAPSAPPAGTDEPEDSAPSAASGPVVAQAAPPPPAPKSAPPRPAQVASEAHAAAPKPAPRAAPEPVTAAPVQVAEARAAAPKPAPRPAPEQVAAPVQVAVARSVPAPHAVARPEIASSASNAAVAPGTIGESVLRAMRVSARPTGSWSAPQPVAAPVPVAPVQVAPTPIASYAPAPQGSLLGFARGSLPPPVPYAAR